MLELNEKYASVILRHYEESTGSATGISVVRNGETIPYAMVVKEVGADG